MRLSGEVEHIRGVVWKSQTASKATQTRLKRTGRETRLPSEGNSSEAAAGSVSVVRGLPGESRPCPAQARRYCFVSTGLPDASKNSFCSRGPI